MESDGRYIIINIAKVVDTSFTWEYFEASIQFLYFNHDHF